MQTVALIVPVSHKAKSFSGAHYSDGLTNLFIKIGSIQQVIM
jgi:hypothetical protein